MPLRALVHRFGLFFLLAAAFSLMLLGKGEGPVFERFRASLVDVVTPILDVMSGPAEAVSETVANVREVARLREDNLRLRDENAQLRHWETVARNVSDQNASLRLLLNLAPEGSLSY